MRIARILLGALLALCTALPAVPQTGGATGTVYNIELVVFRVISGSGAENWSAQASTRIFGNSDETDSAGAQIGHFVSTIAPTQFQLGTVESRLRSSGNYAPIAHAAWSQTASAWGTRAGFSLDRLGLEAEGLTGTVFLERGQYLHLGMTLNYAPTNPPAGLAAGAGTTFVLSESRRVRFFERNYYDHPAFGVIALVTPAQGSRAPGR